MRRRSRRVQVGDVPIGGGAEIPVQSMTKTHTEDVPSTIAQIRRLEAAGCKIVRVAVPDKSALEALPKIKQAINIPLVADIHFRADLAIGAIRAGVDKIRINPGNISAGKLVEIARYAKQAGVPVRIGVNSGSVKIKRGENVGDAMVRSALEAAEIFQDAGWDELVLSLKASDVMQTIECYREVAERCDYPLHLGVTATGLPREGVVKSSVGIGVLLAEGIGDTLRVSLTDDPVREVEVGYLILESLGLAERGRVRIISCPMCGRCQIDLLKLLEEVRESLADVQAPIKVAVMGCMVNGPGEARDADVGIAGGEGKVVVFRKGRIVRMVDEADAIKVLQEEIDEILQGEKKGL